MGGGTSGKLGLFANTYGAGHNVYNYMASDGGSADRYVVLFAGINTNTGDDKFKAFADALKAELEAQYPGQKVNVLTVYPYDDTISGDGYIPDMLQVTKNAFNIKGNTVSDMADAIKQYYNGEGRIDFVGYSGGGVAATKALEQLEKSGWKPYVSSVTRLGAPDMNMNSWYENRTTNISQLGDPVPAIHFKRGGTGFMDPTKLIPTAKIELSPISKTLNVKKSTIKGLEHSYNPIEIHTSYYANESNRVKTASAIVKSMAATTAQKSYTPPAPRPIPTPKATPKSSAVPRPGPAPSPTPVPKPKKKSASQKSGSSPAPRPVPTPKAAPKSSAVPRPGPAPSPISAPKPKKKSASHKSIPVPKPHPVPTPKAKTKSTAVPMPGPAPTSRK